jgi:hypothetical protein
MLLRSVSYSVAALILAILFVAVGVSLSDSIKFPNSAMQGYALLGTSIVFLIQQPTQMGKTTKDGRVSSLFLWIAVMLAFIIVSMNTLR